MRERTYILTSWYGDKEEELVDSTSKQLLVLAGRHLRDASRRDGDKTPDGHDYQYRVRVKATQEVVWNSYIDD